MSEDAASAKPGTLKRFYKDVSVQAVDDRFEVQLDGRGLRTPKRLPVAVPSQGVAQLLASEWRDAGALIDPQAMPVTRIVNIALDEVASHTGAIAQSAASYLGTDTVLFRAEEPPDLVTAQSATWDPCLAWAAERFGAQLAVSRTLAVPVLPDGLEARVSAAAARLEPITLAAFHTAVAASGSLILGTMLLEGALSGDAAFEAGCLEALWQAEHWGVDPEAEAGRERIRADLVALDALFGAMEPRPRLGI